MSLELLRDCLPQGRHVSAFLMLGDPDPVRSLQLAQAAVTAGSTMLELGLPFDDPSADGPAIQAASLRARQGGTSTALALELLAQIRATCPATPLNLLVYGNLVHARGYARFCDDVVAAGASSLLVPDIPHEEAGALRAACAQARLGFVPLVGPRTEAARLRALDATSTAFLYLAALQGVTGADSPATSRTALVRAVTREVTHPVCVGFGLNEPAHVRDAFAAGAAIAVIGSHLARAIAHGCEQPDGPVPAFIAALRPLVAARASASFPMSFPSAENPSCS